MRMRWLGSLLLIIGIAFAGCSRKSQEQSDSAAPRPEDLKPASAHGSSSPTAAMPDAAAPAAASAAAAADADGLTFSTPSGWTSETPTSTNRQAQYKLERAAGDREDAELVVYHFPGGGGTPQANVDRWISQFSKPDGSPATDTARVLKKNIAGIPITVVDVSGSYAGSAMMMQQPAPAKSHFRMLGAIAEARSGLWFFKLTGPENTVKKWQSSFDTFLNSIRQGK